jgi:hypothetical protein
MFRYFVQLYEAGRADFPNSNVQREMTLQQATAPFWAQASIHVQQYHLCDRRPNAGWSVDLYTVVSVSSCSNCMQRCHGKEMARGAETCSYMISNEDHAKIKRFEAPRLKLEYCRQPIIFL